MLAGALEHGNKKSTSQTVKSMETHLLKDCLMWLLSFSPGGFSSLSTEDATLNTSQPQNFLGW